MITTFDAVFLGIVQGLTEFLPVSSSGHLVFFQKLLGYAEPMIAFDIAVHLGTFFAVAIYFWKELSSMAGDGLGFVKHVRKPAEWDKYFKDHVYALTLGYVILSTLATIVVALIFKDSIETMFTSIRVVGIAWIIIGALLIWSVRFQSGGRSLYEMNHSDAFLLGIAQGLAIIPGVSRSGLTIICAMALGLEKKTAAKYSFLMGLFAIAAASVYEAKEGLEFFSRAPLALGLGLLTSAVTGYLAIFILMKLIEKGRFFIFGFYCVLMGILSLSLDFLGIF